jgi:hypothetical protein
MPITLDSRVQRRDHLVSARVESELVLLDPERDKYLSLNDVGTEIWERLAAPATVRELCEELGRHFDGPPARIEEDVLAFLAELEQRALVCVLPEQP